MIGPKVIATKVGVIGLGSMEYGITASLIGAEHVDCAADVNAGAVARLQADGAVAKVYARNSGLTLPGDV